MQEKFFDNRINDLQRTVNFNRIQFLKTLEQDNLSVAAEILFDFRARFGKSDLDFLARQKKKTCNGKYLPLSKSFVGGS